MVFASREGKHLRLVFQYSSQFRDTSFSSHFFIYKYIFFERKQSEPFDDISTYRGDIIVGLKFVPPDAKTSHFSRSSISSGLRKFGSIKSSSGSRSSSSKGSLHVLVKEAKNLSPVKANGTCDAFCKR